MDVDHSWGDEEPIGVDRAMGRVRRDVTDCADPAGVDRDVGGAGRAPGPIDHPATTDYKVVHHPSLALSSS
jgi:hypothetical protein